MTDDAWKGQLIELMDDSLELHASLDVESDRGCALMTAAYLSDQLEKLLRAAFVADDRAVNQLFEPMSILGSFASRIELCYVLGLLPDKARRDLHLVRKIRNEFGHSARPLAFTEESVALRCGELYHCAQEPEDSPRSRFVGAAYGVSGVIIAMTLQAKQPGLAKNAVVDAAHRQAMRDRASDEIILNSPRERWGAILYEQARQYIEDRRASDRIEDRRQDDRSHPADKVSDSQ